MPMRSSKDARMLTPGLCAELRSDFVAVRSHSPPMLDWLRARLRIVGGNRPGRWKDGNAPCALEPLAAYTDDTVEVIAVAAPAQLMKSTYIVSCAL